MIKLIVKAPINDQEKKDFAYEFDQPVITIGRLKENDIPLPLSTISGFHAQILKENDQYYLMDRGSINGTFLNEQRLVAGERKLVRDGDVIRIQTFEIYFSSGMSAVNIESGATVQIARQMVMEVLGAWESKGQEKPRMIVMGGPDNGKQYELTEQKSLIIGREVTSDIQIDHPSVSRKHAEISFTWSGAFIKDLNSSNGVFVNDQRIAGSQKLHDRDMIRAGQQNSDQAIHLVFSDPAEALISKMDDRAFTDSNPPAPLVAERASETAVEPIQPDGSSAMPPPPEAYLEPQPVMASQPAYTTGVPKPSTFPTIALVIVALVIVLVLAGLGYFLFLQPAKMTVDSVEPSQGFSGQTVLVSGKDLDSNEVKSVQIYQEPAPIMQRQEHQVVVRIPEFRNINSLVNTEIVVEGKKSVIGRLPFRLITEPSLRSVSPDSGAPGSQVHILLAGPVQGTKVYFGDQEASTQPSTGSDIVAIVPTPMLPIPPEGLPTTITVKSYGSPIKNNLQFKMIPQAVAESDRFQLTFSAKPYTSSLGFNEYAVETNLGPLLILVSHDQYASSQERAENTSRALNDAASIFQSDPNERVDLEKNGDTWQIVAKGAADERVLLRVFPEDALAYGKINARVVSVDELAQWWQMLLDAYYKVFVQVADPAESGILATGGTIFQQIYSFYPVAQGTQKYFKRDLPTALASDQKTRLLALSLTLPERVATVEGSWAGLMSNKLYSNISEENLEIILTLRQNDNGNISGNAEVNWKIVMGEGTGGFQNVAVKKLGIFGLSGRFDRTKAYPVEFSFVEKDGRRLNFVGKLEGDILGGSFVVGANGEEGTWTVRLKKG